MAILYITEYQFLGSVPQNSGQMPQETPIAEQTVAIGVGSVQSNAFNANTRFVRLNCDVVCSVLFGVNPTVTATSGRMAANQTEYRSLPLGSLLKVAVINNT